MVCADNPNPLPPTASGPDALRKIQPDGGVLVVRVGPLLELNDRVDLMSWISGSMIKSTGLKPAQVAKLVVLHSEAQSHALNFLFVLFC